ncbi:Synaptic vesicular amine transporter [Frankliniella fusca]|uniref:Synaptic vesicular amine transporter n=1 Tax=Frankliniella fusca TaxID=407009 RepID=A0AAE1HHP9_9NEOP|nr:Synaptic vesicular amine transporter [Frankliniella fusca]
MLGFLRALQEDKPRGVLLLLVYLSLLVDNMLLTVVVPVIPDYLVTSEGLVLAPVPQDPFPLTAGLRGDNASSRLTATSPSSASAAASPPSAAGCGPGPGRGMGKCGAGAEGGSATRPAAAVTEESDGSGEGGRVGLLLSSKAWVQLAANPVVGVLTATLGTRIPLLAGSINLVLASMLFALGESYAGLFVARSLQGVASACIGVAGMCLVAEQFPEESERSRALGLVLGSIALGVLLGYPLGSVAYEFLGKPAPFLVVCGLAFVLALLQLTLLDVRSPTQAGAPAAPAAPALSTRWRALVSDWAVLLSAGAILLSSSCLAILEPCLPIWLKTSIRPEKWQMGTVFLPDSVGYLLGTHFLGEPALWLGRWRVASAALMLLGVSAALVCTARNLWQLVLPHFGLGLGVGSVDAALVPLLAYLVDTRHGAGYGAVYALQQTAVSLAYALGPMLGGALMRVVGFPWLMRSLGALCLLCSPLLALLARLDMPDKLPQRRRSLASQAVVNYQSGEAPPHRTAYARFGDSDDSD